jgi:hypothetical protein
MRRAAVIVLTLALPSLAGCFPDQAKDEASCEAQASRFFAIYHAVDPNAPASRYIIECMQAKGYRFTLAPEDCDSRHALPTQPACYTPNNWVVGLYDQLRRRLTTN